MIVNLHRLPDGSLMDYGRHWRLFGKEGYGSAKHYGGEALEVMNLVLRYSRKENN